MESLFDPHIIAGLLTLIVIEIVLGIDNLVFIAILADRLPPDQRNRARVLGLSLALLMRLLLLASISWLVTLTTPLLSVGGFNFSGRDLILLVGGIFLLFKGTMELHERLEGPAHEGGAVRGHARFFAVIVQIVVLDAIFSLDSVITAVGMIDDLKLMMVAVTIAMIVMIVASKPLTQFVNSHPTVINLCLAFLLMIGLSLVAEAFGVDIPKGYLYAAIAFSIIVESINQVRLANVQRRLARMPLRQRTTDAVLRLLGERRESEADVSGVVPPAEVARTFASAERDMVAGVMLLGDRLTQSIMTPRQDIVWLDIDASIDDMRQTLTEHGHSRYPVCEGTVERLEGVILARDILPDLLDGRRPDLRARMHVPLSVRDRLPVLRLIDLLKTTPTRFAVVVADHGTVEGVVTPTDVLAAIAGGLVEDEDAVPMPVHLDDGAIHFDGTTAVDEAAMLIDMPAMRGDGDYATIAGFVLDRLRHIPVKGESFDWGDWRFAVTEMDGHRIVGVTATPVDDG